MWKKYATVIAVVISTITVLGSLWTVFSYADGTADGVEQNKEGVKENKEVVAQHTAKLVTITQAAQVAVQNKAAIETMQVQIKRNVVTNSIGVQQLNLDAIRRQKRRLASKDQFGTLEQWEHAELLQLRDDEATIQSVIQNQQIQLQSIQ